MLWNYGILDTFWVGLGLVPGTQTLGGDEHLRGLLRNGVGTNTYKKGRMLF